MAIPEPPSEPAAPESWKIEAIQSSSIHPQVSNKDIDQIIIKRSTGLDLEEIAQNISRKFPKAPEFLKQRLAVSIDERQSSFLSRQKAHVEGQILPGSQATHAYDALSQSRGSNDLTDSEKWENEEDIPGSPQIESSQSRFECPNCFAAKPSGESHVDSWAQQVMRDQRSYLCLLEHCTTPQASFNTVEEWIEHMKAEQIDSTPDVFTYCPLCSYPPEENLENPSFACRNQEHLQKHIANHLRSLALLSFPPSRRVSGPAFENVNALPPVVPPRISHPNLILPRPTQLPTQPQFNHPHPPPEIYIHPIMPSTNSTSSLRQPQLPRSARLLQTPINVIPTSLLPPKTETFDVLLAEDNCVNQKIISLMLGRYQHRVVIASDGAEAVAAVKKRKYDVILMDTEMPVMGGLEATSQIRTYEQSMGIARTPIIALTADARQETLERIVRGQMDDVLCKPMKFRALVEKVTWYGRLGRNAVGLEMSTFLDSISAGVGVTRTEFVAKL